MLVAFGMPLACLWHAFGISGGMKMHESMMFFCMWCRTHPNCTTDSRFADIAEATSWSMAPLGGATRARVRESWLYSRWTAGTWVPPYPSCFVWLEDVFVAFS